MELSTLLFFFISFPASAIGATCGIGGGVIIKPLLDAFGLASVSAISFLSGCTVLAMSCYSIEKNLLAHENQVDFAVGTPLAIGGAVGGVAGKQLFSMIAAASGNAEFVGFVQAVCLALITLGTFLYTLKKSSIKTRKINSKPVCVLVGLLLGILSSFLGIGGGPINLVVLYYLFSMDTKTAAQNSLYIIMFSQFASLITTLVTRRVPEFSMAALILMIVGGIAGGMLGRSLNHKLNNKAVEKLFLCAMAVIILICCYNAVKFII